MTLRKDKDYIFDEIKLFPKIKKSKIIKKDSVKEQLYCCLCLQNSANLKFINCLKGYVQKNLPLKGKTYNCCHDKPICEDCIIKCKFKCPFCKCHTLYDKFSYCKKKLPYAKRLQRKKNKEKYGDLIVSYLVQNGFSHSENNNLENLSNDFLNDFLNVLFSEDLPDWGSDIETISEDDE